MILRRITKHVRTQNWFAVLLDFLIVVVGVFIGIEVANWNAGRQDRLEERRYYAQILEDLRSDLVTLDTAIERAGRHDQAAERVLAALQSGVTRNDDPAKLAVAIHFAGFLYIPSASRGTYDELISTGNLRLLRDPELKRRLARYYASFEENRQWDILLRGQQNDYWSETAGISPRPVLQAAMRGTPARVSADEVRQIIAVARQRPRLQGMLMGMAAHQERVRRDSEVFARDARALVTQVEDHL